MAEKAAAVQRVRLLVSEDRLRAWVHVPLQELPAPPAPSEVLAALEAGKIPVDDSLRQRVEVVVAEIGNAIAAAQSGATDLPKAFLVVEGAAPREAEDARFEWAEDLAERLGPAQTGGHVDYFAQNTIITVPPNTPIGRIIPAQPGSAGRDVYGHTRPPRRSAGSELRPGAGVRLREGSTELWSEVGGRVLVEQGKVRISEVLDINGDVDFSSGSVDSCVDVAVHGTVRANFKLHTTKSLLVDRVIEAADVVVGENIVVRGGIFGGERAGQVRAGGALSANLLNETRVQVGGELRFNKEILNSAVHVNGRLIGERGVIIGGNVYAREGVNVRVLGSEAGVATLVAVGTHIDTLRRVRQLERQIKDLGRSAEQIRDAVKPLLANLKRLLAPQRERATELLSKADELELQMDGLRTEARELLKVGAPPAPAAVLVHEYVYPGTHIICETREVRVAKLVHGPVKIELRKVNDVTELVAVNQRTASVTILPATDVDLDQPPASDPASEGPR